MLRVSDTILVEYDETDDGDCTLSVVRTKGKKFFTINTFKGREAKEIYTKLTDEEMY